jgi:hypothetical protein
MYAECMQHESGTPETSFLWRSLKKALFPTGKIKGFFQFRVMQIVFPA